MRISCCYFRYALSCLCLFTAFAFPSLLNAQATWPASDSKTPGFVNAELVFPIRQAPTPQCHAATIAETPTGLVVAWFGGTKEKNADVGIWLSRLEGQRWSKPQLIVTGEEHESIDYACWNPVLFQPKAKSGSEPLTLFYKVGITSRLWWGMATQSTDGGKTWAPPIKLGTSKHLPKQNPNLTGPAKNKLIELSDGTWMCGSSSENEHGWHVHFETSKDQGKTWQATPPIDDSEKFNAIQPTFLIHGENRLQILCRSKEGVVVKSESDDNGATWSKLTATNLPNPNSGLDAVTLTSGQHLLVLNPTKEGRRTLSVVMSNNGDDWFTVWTLEDRGGEYSYPSAIQTSDGNVHIVYTWRRKSIRHIVLDPKKLKQLPSGLPASGGA